jgi:hypothetical protein
MQDLIASKLVAFIIKELRCMQSEMVIDQALGKTNLSAPSLDNTTCISEFIKDLNKSIDEQSEFVKKLSYKEGKYDAYKKILDIIQEK